jgi:ATP-binding cassette, subfamily F, member 2
MSKWHQKQAKKAEFQAMKDEEDVRNSINIDLNLQLDTRAAAMGQGDEELYEKKLSKDEKKALAKAKREAKKNNNNNKDNKDNNNKNNKDKSVIDDDGEDNATITTLPSTPSQLSLLNTDGTSSSLPSHDNLKEMKRMAALDDLSKQSIAVTYESKKGMLHANTRDINVSGVTVTFHGKPLIEDTDVVISYGNRYGFIGSNGSGKSTIMKMIAARAIPIPDAIDIYFLDAEYEASDTITALGAVLDVQDEVHVLEARADALNNQMANAGDNDELLHAIQIELENIYSKLDQLDVNTAEARAAGILFGLGFTKKMQTMKTREFSGGWRMRIALARALFLKPEFLLLDEPVRSIA